MGVYIEGMGFPCEEIEPMIFEVYADGTVYAYTDKKRVDDFLELKAVEVKDPHGRLGDLDALATQFKGCLPKALENESDFNKCLIKAAAIGFVEDLKNAPTIIEAEGNDEADT